MLDCAHSENIMESKYSDFVQEGDKLKEKHCLSQMLSHQMPIEEL